MSAIKIEFAVQMTCGACVEAVKKSLNNIPGIKNVEISLENQSVVVDTILSTLEVQQKIESSGRKVVVRGYAGNSCGVAILETGQPNIQGVVRFVQATPNSCIIDGTIDGLEPNATHRLSVHECGDISQGCESVGNLFNPKQPHASRIYGDLGVVTSENNGRASFRLEDEVLRVPEIVGRSLVLSQSKNHQRVICGIIARSAGLFQNPKTICACDGVTIWDEKTKPAQVAPKSTL